jgi:peroxiredoxin
MGQRITLAINTLAPGFDTIDVFGRPVSLRQYRGKRLMICFFRHAGCPFCNMRVHRLQAKYDELKALGLEMVFFFESEEKTILGHHFHRSVSPIPIIADPDKIHYAAYGIETSFSKSLKSHATSFLTTAIKAAFAKVPLHYMSGKESFSTMPAEFLINEYGMIQALLYSNGLTDHMNLDEVLRFAKTGKTA